MRVRRLLTTVCAGLALLAAAGCGADDSGGGGDADTLRIASNSNASCLTTWVAIEKGIFKEHGIDADYTKVENVGTLPPALDKSFDVVFVTPVQAIAAVAQGIPITEISGSTLDTTENPNSYLMVAKDSPYKDLKDLEGKTIGVLTEVGTLHYATLNMLQQAGVDPASIKIQQVDGPTQLDQLQAGRVDAVETLAPFSQQLEQAGATSLGTPFASLGDEVSVIWWAASNDWVDENPDKVTAFQDSLEEAEKFIEENDAEAREILQKYSGLPAEVVKTFPLPDYDASVRPDDIDRWLKVMQDVADFQGQVDTSQLTATP
ncbi:ABC transporter substrate-binding protein [Nocardioides sp. LHG3406-4]|uniref:ABC transporter substrate-binding protein n=1 Tax=Nocardioides sp. LHG3406-4 TaxID=2804575 RepID=UPI003CE7A0BF